MPIGIDEVDRQVPVSTRTNGGDRRGRRRPTILVVSGPE
jgi:hypothetical protein